MKDAVQDFYFFSFPGLYQEVPYRVITLTNTWYRLALSKGMTSSTAIWSGLYRKVFWYVVFQLQARLSGIWWKTPTIYNKNSVGVRTEMNRKRMPKIIGRTIKWDSIRYRWFYSKTLYPSRSCISYQSPWLWIFIKVSPHAFRRSNIFVFQSHSMVSSRYKTGDKKLIFNDLFYSSRPHYSITNNYKHL